jgi:transcription initiation factor TFIIF subunit alpha
MASFESLFQKFNYIHEVFQRFKGKKSVSDNSSYFVFIHNTDGGFDAHPIEDWYTFAPHKTYRTLNIDEAEEEFSKRHKILNKYAIMANKRKGDGENEGAGDETEKKTKRSGPRSTRSAFSLTGDGDDEWGEDGVGGGGGGGEDLDDDDNDLDNDEELKDKKKPKKKGKRAGGNDDDEDNIQLHEDSDDGDEDGREQDYDDDDIHTDDDDDLLNDVNKAADEEIGVDQEEAIISLQRDEELNENEDENEDEDDETLTAEGKEYKKLMKEAYNAANKGLQNSAFTRAKRLFDFFTPDFKSKMI